MSVMRMEALAHEISTYRSENPVVEKYLCARKILLDRLRDQDPEMYDMFVGYELDNISNLLAYLRAVNPYNPLVKKGEPVPNRLLSRRGDNLIYGPEPINDDRFTAVCVELLEYYYTRKTHDVLYGKLWTHPKNVDKLKLVC